MRIFGEVRPMAGIGQRRSQTNGMLWVAGGHNPEKPDDQLCNQRERRIARLGLRDCSN